MEAPIVDNEPDIVLYSAQTPNGIKISMTLEELGLPYKLVPINVKENTQKEPWFLKLNPNGRIPALTDTLRNGQQIRLFESGSIMQYLVARYDPMHLISYPPTSREYYEMTNWLFFQNANIGPIQGQATHFHRYDDGGNHVYSENRYKGETRRLYRVLDSHLESCKSGYLVGDRCTIADIAHLGWIALADWSGIDIDAFPNVKAWEQRMCARPKLIKGMNVPTPHRAVEGSKDKALVNSVSEDNRQWIQREQAKLAQQ